MDADEADWADAVLAGSGLLSPEEAAAVLRLPPDVWVDAAATAAAAKSAFRRLCIRWHPDKHSGEEAKERATALFVRIAAAYNTLTTTNFDFSRRVLLRKLKPQRARESSRPSPCRWASTFAIPSLQTLDDVLALALGGADPQVVDAMLRKRGDYRPHARFGVDLAVRVRATGVPSRPFRAETSRARPPRCPGPLVDVKRRAGTWRALRTARLGRWRVAAGEGLRTSSRWHYESSRLKRRRVEWRRSVWWAAVQSGLGRELGRSRAPGGRPPAPRSSSRSRSRRCVLTCSLETRPLRAPRMR